MDQQKIVVVLLLITIILSVVTVVVTVGISLPELQKSQTGQHTSTVPDDDRGLVRLQINEPIGGAG